jgi:hypothetical protein
MNVQTVETMDWPDVVERVDSQTVAKGYLAANRFPILYINLLFIDGIDSVQAVIATELHDQFLRVIDPLEGERSFPLPAFEGCIT